MFCSLNLMVKALAPMLEKLSVNFWFIALMAVIMPISAIIPKAIMATVKAVRRVLPLTVRKASRKVSLNFMLLLHKANSIKQYRQIFYYQLADLGIYPVFCNVLTPPSGARKFKSTASLGKYRGKCPAIQ